MVRLIVYSLLVAVVASVMPSKGEYKEANMFGEALFLKGNKLAVTFPWKGVLIKSGVEGELLAEVIRHENCHIDQINRMGGLRFIVEFQHSAEKFEEECYKKEIDHVEEFKKNKPTK